MNHLSVEQLSKSFLEQPLFNDLTFGVSQGQKIALVGKNGCGKSTLLKIIAGSHRNILVVTATYIIAIGLGTQ